MADKKKFFNERDFDKDKQLFTSEDFEKEKDVSKVSNPATPKPVEGGGNGSENGGKSNTGKIVGGIAAAAAILAGVYFFGIKGDDNSGTDAGNPTEQVAKNGETAQPEATTQTDVPKAETTEEANAVPNATEVSSSTENSESSGAGNDTPTTPKSEKKQSEKPASTTPSISKPVQQTPSKQIDATNNKIAAASAPIGGDVVENAKRVIRGDFGNGQERKDKLGAAYSEIQGKVNEMYRNGQVYR